MKRTLLLAAAAAFAFAAPAEEKVSPASVPGQRATVDPKTGALRPATPEEAKALAPPPARGKPEVVMLPDGSRMLRLNGRHLSWSVARRNPDGSVTFECTRAPEPLPPKAEERP